MTYDITMKPIGMLGGGGAVKARICVLGSKSEHVGAYVLARYVAAVLLVRKDRYPSCGRLT